MGGILSFGVFISGSMIPSYAEEIIYFTSSKVRHTLLILDSTNQALKVEPFGLLESDCFSEFLSGYFSQVRRAQTADRFK